MTLMIMGYFTIWSRGKINLYRNPHEIGQVKVYCSSIGKGKVSDFVGRELVNLRTLNEAYSYFGVDLGEDRNLIPSCYSIKNRNSPAHVLLCWVLEASNDKVKFETIGREYSTPLILILTKNSKGIEIC